MANKWTNSYRPPCWALALYVKGSICHSNVLCSSDTLCNDTKNLKLSQERAAYIAGRLKKQGVDVGYVKG